MMIFKPSGLLGRYEFSLTRVLDKLAGLITGRQAGEKKAQVSQEEGVK